MADYPTIVDGSGGAPRDRKIQASELAATIAEEHKVWANPDEHGLVHSLLRHHVNLGAWTTAKAVGDVETQRRLLQEGLTRGLELMKARQPQLEAVFSQLEREGRLTESMRKEFAAIRNVTTSFDSVDLAGQDISAIAAHVPILGLQIRPPAPKDKGTREL